MLNAGSETAYPRLSMIGDLITTLVSYPTLSRTATSALADLAEAMKASTTAAEIDALLEGAMTEEAFVRFACLQALQVRRQTLQCPSAIADLVRERSLWISRSSSSLPTSGSPRTTRTTGTANSQWISGRRTVSTFPSRDSFRSSCPSSVCCSALLNAPSLSSRSSTAHSSNAIRQATAQSIAEGIDMHPAQVAGAIQQLVAEYHEKVSSFIAGSPDCC